MLMSKCRIHIRNIFLHLTMSCAHPLTSCCFVALFSTQSYFTNWYGHSSRLRYCLVRRSPSWRRQHFFWFSLFSSLLWPTLSIRLRLHFLFFQMICFSSLLLPARRESLLWNKTSPLLEFSFDTELDMDHDLFGNSTSSVFIVDPGWSLQHPWSISILFLRHSFLSATVLQEKKQSLQNWTGLYPLSRWMQIFGEPGNIPGL